MVLALVIFGLLSLVMFGMFDLNRFSFPPLIFMSGFIIFIIIIVGISAISMSMRETYKTPKEENLKSYNLQNQSGNQYVVQNSRNNPYVNRKSIQDESYNSVYGEIKNETPNISSINYCRFCGAKVDRDAVFCHQCGIDLSS